MPDLKTRRRGFESHSGHKNHIFRTSVARGKKHLVLLNHLKTFKANRDYLDKLQTRAASIIEGRKVEQCEIHDILDWPTLDSRRKYQICLQVFKCVNGLAPACLLNEFNFSRDFHKYKTRNKDLIRVTRAKTTKYQSSFRYNGAKAWNTLPHLVRTETSLSSFKHKLKKHLFM